MIRFVIKNTKENSYFYRTKCDLYFNFFAKCTPNIYSAKTFKNYKQAKEQLDNIIGNAFFKVVKIEIKEIENE